MNCPIEGHHPEMLVAYTAGELDREIARALERHMADCAACRSTVAAQSAVWKALDAWEAPPVSRDFDRRLYGRIDEDQRPSWWDRLMRPLRAMPFRQALPLTASAGLIVMAGLLLHHPVAMAPAAAQPQAVRAVQVEKTLDDLDLLRQLGAADTTKEGETDAL